MSNEKNRSISGNWFGNYYYRGGSQAFGFEAVFIESDGAVQGSILDDGMLGEAQVAGSYAAPNLEFTKRYPRTDAVRYQGTLSEDDNQVSGTWSAWRNSEGDDEDVREFDRESNPEEQLEQESRPKPVVAR